MEASRIDVPLALPSYQGMAVPQPSVIGMPVPQPLVIGIVVPQPFVGIDAAEADTAGDIRGSAVPHPAVWRIVLNRREKKRLAAAMNGPFDS